jgi:hypothetical protein
MARPLQGIVTGVHLSPALKRENTLPVALHVNDCPSSRLRFIESLVETANAGISVVSPLAVGIRVMNIEAKAPATARSYPLEHLQVAIGVTERGDWATANVLINANRFTGFVVNEVDLWQANEHRLPIAQLKLRLDAASDDLLRRNAGLRYRGCTRSKKLLGEDQGRKRGAR